MQTIQQLGRYEILAELGRGAMGAVFRARDPRIDRTVAIKTIGVPGADRKSLNDYRERFFREAQAAGRLSHPGIVTIFDVSEDQTTLTPFIVMEFVNGTPLNEYVSVASQGHLPLDAALDLVQQLAEALHYAHSAGIVHRDIKPANILITGEGRAKIADFGIAKAAMSEATVPGQVMGTPGYMSPEQINGRLLDGRSDLFSLGVIAYWLLTGQKPFEGESITEVCVRVVSQEPALPSSVYPTLGQDFDYVLGRALAKDPAQRYQNGKAFALDVQDLLAGRAPRSKTITVNSSPITPDPTVAVGTVAAAAKTNPSDSAEPGTTAPGRRGLRWPLYTAAALLLMFAGAALLALSSSPRLPATLQVVGNYPFQSGQVYVWVDGELRYEDALRGPDERSRHPHTAHISAGAMAITLPVRAGKHIIRVQVDAPGNQFDHDTAIPGQFRAYSQKTLTIDFRSKNLALAWE
ncbi:MAG TPA: serine/threonine-protein kinase [Candidatus Limnocylindrales bacterium]|jgi:serine/threonine-protein kinase|nr:serine/threonine-protein kinase [Candidatus Limnocylindrales bacterium]